MTSDGMAASEVAPCGPGRISITYCGRFATLPQRDARSALLLSCPKDVCVGNPGFPHPR
jgi:hypothetical protein